MSYRSIKRVLGETSLERKCRLLFGVCLALLIFGAFWWVDRVAENLIRENMRDRASKLISMQLLRHHLEAQAFTATTAEREKSRKQAETVVQDLESPNVPFEMLVLDQSQISERDGMSLNDIHARVPAQGDEEKIIERLSQSVQDELAKRQAANENPDRGETAKKNGPPKKGLENTAIAATAFIDKRIFGERFVGQEYYYYEPIHFTVSCMVCHHDAKATDRSQQVDGTTEPPAVEMSNAANRRDELKIDHFMRIVISSEDMQTAINRARAILISVAILTVFLSVFALYLIIRYVIVKPLQHLQSVSDSVSQGKTEMRAELFTGDEFEELAASFNRMLRHMTDTQNKLQRVNEDLDHKVDELAQVNMRLYEMNQLKNEFLANMSHELRTPLNSIIGFSEVLQGISSLSDKQKKFATNIRTSGHVLLQMINEILDLAKLEAGKMEVNPSEFRIETVVNAHCEMVRALTEEKNINLQVRCQKDLPPVFQDQVKIQQILNNLLSNAIKFTPEGGRITVHVEKTDHDNLRLIVEDTGVGIAEEDRDIIFEKFRQAPSTNGGDNLTREFSGTGLGLSIVKELCNLLEGSIEVESAIGRGSTFSVTLPWSSTADSFSVSMFNRKFSELTKSRASELRRETPRRPLGNAVHPVEDHPAPAADAIEAAQPTK